MSLESLLEINDPRAMRVEIRKVGHDQIPVMIADNFLKYPDRVREFALQLDFRKPLPGDLWPGSQAAASVTRQQMDDFVKSRYIKDVLGLDCAELEFPPVRPGEKADQWSSWFNLTRFGIVSMPYDEAPWARNPHVDHFGFIASVVYLSRDEDCRGGTVFIRHRATGIETIPPFAADLPASISEKIRSTNSFRIISELIPEAFSGGVASESVASVSEGDRILCKRTFQRIWKLITEGNPATEGYLTAGNAAWELIDQVDMRFNRLVLYPTWHLHSVSWDPAWFDKHPERSRLTMMNWMNFPIAKDYG